MLAFSKYVTIVIGDFMTWPSGLMLSLFSNSKIFYSLNVPAKKILILTLSSKPHIFDKHKNYHGEIRKLY